jgi:hypothetical protein
MVVPKIFHLNNYKLDANIDDSIIFSPFQSELLFTLGYHYFIDRTRENISIAEKLESKNEIYYIVNSFEPNIIKSNKEYFNNNLQDHNFYKTWEMFLIFNLVDDKKCDFINVPNIESINSSLEIYRKKFFKQSFKNVKKNSTLIFDTISEIKEVDSYELLIEKLLNIFKNQEEGGHLIFGLNDTFSLVTLKCIYLLLCSYDDCYIYKPYFSRGNEIEKFIICKNYKKNDKIIKLLESINKKINSEKEVFIIDVFSKFKLDNDLINLFRYINIELVNQQQIIINDIIKYVKNNNYFGDLYHKYKNIQEESGKWWEDNFMPNDKKLNEKRELFLNTFKTIFDKNKIEIKKLSDEFI